MTDESANLLKRQSKEPECPRYIIGRAFRAVKDTRITEVHKNRTAFALLRRADVSYGQQRVSTSPVCAALPCSSAPRPPDRPLPLAAGPLESH